MYLGCTQRIDRKLACPDSRSAKRISEARLPIDRYACEGKIVINIDINVHRAEVTICHLIAHKRPTYREKKYRLCEEELIVCLSTICYKCIKPTPVISELFEAI